MTQDELENIVVWVREAKSLLRKAAGEAVRGRFENHLYLYDGKLLTLARAVDDVEQMIKAKITPPFTLED